MEKIQKKRQSKTYSFSFDKQISDVIDEYFERNNYLNKSKIVGQIIYDWIKSQKQ
jgi:hypothetical protein